MVNPGRYLGWSPPEQKEKNRPFWPDILKVFLPA